MSIQVSQFLSSSVFSTNQVDVEVHVSRRELIMNIKVAKNEVQKFSIVV